ncbi:MAG: hypothetical protein AAF410_06605 [Pseudomonadota bacterium]
MKKIIMGLMIIFAFLAGLFVTRLTLKDRQPVYLPAMQETINEKTSDIGGNLNFKDALV